MRARISFFVYGLFEDVSKVLTISTEAVRPESTNIDIDRHVQ